MAACRWLERRRRLKQFSRRAASGLSFSRCLVCPFVFAPSLGPTSKLALTLLRAQGRLRLIRLSARQLSVPSHLRARLLVLLS